MAIVTNTVEYCFASRTTTLTASSRHDFSAVTIYIPENSSRTILSAEVQVFLRDQETTEYQYLENPMIGIKLGAVAFSDNTITLAPYNQFYITAPQTFFLTSDVTSYFVSNFGSGTSQTCQVAFQCSNLDTINISAKVLITYQFDDAAQDTRVKTVRIPMDGITGNLTNTLTEIGTNQIPNLDTFLPEASKTYRNIWFEITGNERSSATTDFTLGLGLDSESEVNDGTHEQAIIGSPYYKYIWVRNDMTTSATHQFKMRTTVTGRMNLANVLIYVTYEYSHTSSTKILNSLLIPLENVCSPIGKTTSANKTTVNKKFFIEEESIVLKQSGILGTLFYTDYDVVGNLNIQCGGQSYRTYVPEHGNSFSNNFSGIISYMHRIDSGAAVGAGITLSRGENTFEASMYSDGANIVRYNTYVLYLNYESDKHSLGANAHNHSVFFNIKGSSNVSDFYVESEVDISIPESVYYLNSVGLETFLNMGYITNTSSVCIEVRAGEMEDGYGWTDGLRLVGATVPESVQGQYYSDVSHNYNRHEDDPSDLLNYNTPRRYLFSGPRSNNLFDLRVWLTYYGINYTIGGTITGYSGGGDGIVINIYRADNNKLISRTTTTSGGAFTSKWYDNTIDIFCEAYQASDKKGRSQNAPAV